jgi:isochorismate synthase EntC
MSIWSKVCGKSDDQDSAPAPAPGEPEAKAPAAVQPNLKDLSTKRRFTVAHSFDTKTGEIARFMVTDCVSNEELNRGRRPAVAEFPVSVLYDARQQKQNAEQYAEYMNRLEQARQQVYEQNLLIDLIKQNP